MVARVSPSALNGPQKGRELGVLGRVEGEAPVFRSPVIASASLAPSRP